MTNKEIKAAIERLRQPTGYNVINDITNLIGDGHWTDQTVRNRLIELLEQADPDAHMKLPVDADGVLIHIGDMMDCGEHFGVREVEGFIHNAIAFTVYDPQPARICTCPAHKTHRPKPTVEDVLRGMLDAVADGSVSYDDAATEYAKLLRLREEDE